MGLRWTTGLWALALLVGIPAGASAFCGFYVGGGGAELFNNATQVVLMRQGTRTVLSMQNNYEGPVADFAMVVPVPVVLRKEEVKTLPGEIFDRIDALSAPRLVEYWERDPCYREMRMEALRSMAMPESARASKSMRRKHGVTIEAKFSVGEYKVLILSAQDSTGLETWLRQEKYRIPAGAAALLRPYVQSGMKFFVAKVDVKKVRFEGGMAKLSPLRFHYDSDDFALPIRLGMMNSSGTQDLIVHILSPEGRYVVANYDNVSIPTNLDLSEQAKSRFGEFYAALFDDTLAKHPGAVVTEYAWDASNCDPCPTPALRQHELLTLGADVLNTPRAEKPKPAPPAVKPGPKAGTGNPLDMIQAPQRRRRPRRARPRTGFVLTRLHARYGKGAAADDLVFEQAGAVVGGREFLVKGDVLEQGAVESQRNAFQARYAIRHPWTGPIACENPVRGRWGGPPGGGSEKVRPARDLAFAPRGKLRVAPLVKRGRATPQLLASAKGAQPPAPGTLGATVAPVTPSALEAPSPVVEPVPTAPTVPTGLSQAEPETESGKDCSISQPGKLGTRPLALLWLLPALALYQRRRRTE